MWYDRLTESKAGSLQMLQLDRRQIRVALRHECECLVHPLDLLLFRRTQHTALADGVEQFVSRLVERIWFAPVVSWAPVAVSTRQPIPPAEIRKRRSPQRNGQYSQTR
jgi:hypothetical protein